ncbi:claudin-4-like [Poecilia latipinna]|uniref:claudin-4-like n=1 Tax=Poecilia latipinna TaxID=48699 RepID=UPI00072E0FC2|nr:PREDICTED: claudin-4-like [Poecilia latipinna]
MASTAVQMLCVALGTIGLIGVIICSGLPRWVVGHQGDTEFHYGLLMECQNQNTGLMQCTKFDSIPSELQAARAMTAISCIFGILSLLFLSFGANFTTCIQNKNSKTKMIQAAGVGLMLAGLLVIIPVSLVAHNILRNKQCLSRDIGASIYIGWAAGMLMILTQGLLLSFGRPRAAGALSSSGAARISSRTSSTTVSSGGVTATSVALVSSYHSDRV